MKKIRLLILSFLTAWVSMAEVDSFDVLLEDTGDIMFTYIRITATSDQTYSPLSADGSWYNGFSGATDAKVYGKTPFLAREDGYAYTRVEMDIASMSSNPAYYFFAELLNEEDEVVGWGGGLEWAKMDLARSWMPDGYTGGWYIDNMQAAPVPEPTSGVLLLIGGALLGLRRKRRA